MLPDTIRQCKRNVFHHCSDEVDKSNIVEFVNRSDVTECLINRLMETDIARFNYETSDNKTKTTYKEFIT